MHAIILSQIHIKYNIHTIHCTYAHVHLKNVQYEGVCVCILKFALIPLRIREKYKKPGKYFVQMLMLALLKPFVVACNVIV